MLISTCADALRMLVRFTVSPNHVWDACLLLSLLQDNLDCEEFLVVGHTGAQHMRFIELVQDRNHRMRTTVPGALEAEHIEEVDFIDLAVIHAKVDAKEPHPAPQDAPSRRRSPAAVSLERQQQTNG